MQSEDDYENGVKHSLVYYTALWKARLTEEMHIQGVGPSLRPATDKAADQRLACAGQEKLLGETSLFANETLAFMTMGTPTTIAAIIQSNRVTGVVLAHRLPRMCRPMDRP